MKNLIKSHDIKNVFDLPLSKLLILNIKNVYSTWATRIVIIFSPIFVVFSLSILFPIQLFVAAGQVFVVPLSAGIVYGMVYFPIKRSTLDDNISITLMSKFQVYITILLTMLFVTFCSEIIFWTSLIIFNKIGIAGTTSILNIITLDKDLDVRWVDVEWMTIFYYWIISTTIVFLVSFLFRGVTKTINWYYSVVFIYILFLISFGGLLEGPLIKVEDNNIILDNKVGFIYVVSSILPQSHLDIFVTKAMNSGIYNIISGDTYNNLGEISSFSISTDWQWNLSLFYPWVFLLASAIGCYLSI